MVQIDLASCPSYTVYYLTYLWHPDQMGPAHCSEYKFIVMCFFMSILSEYGNSVEILLTITGLQSAMGRWAKKTKKGSSELPEASRSRGNSQKKSNLARLNPSASDAKPESGGEATTQVNCQSCLVGTAPRRQIADKFACQKIWRTFRQNGFDDFRQQLLLLDI